MIDLKKEREVVHGAINTLFDIAKVQKAEIDLLNAEIATKQLEIDSLKAKLAKYESGEFVMVPKESIGNYYYDECENMYIDDPD
ncbi:hypothetical protein, partial [Acinetobacter puyangensis]|uniref:hypothetical protein n=1 Tax=Acinetobacter puyangensis TaxID=1096779 RepID=UPI003A4DE439